MLLFLSDHCNQCHHLSPCHRLHRNSLSPVRRPSSKGQFHCIGWSLPPDNVAWPTSQAAYCIYGRLASCLRCSRRLDVGRITNGIEHYWLKRWIVTNTKLPYKASDRNEERRPMGFQGRCRHWISRVPEYQHRWVYQKGHLYYQQHLARTETYLRLIYCKTSCIHEANKNRFE